MKYIKAIALFVLFVSVLTSCGDSEYSEAPTGAVLSLPKADCGSSPCM